MIHHPGVLKSIGIHNNPIDFHRIPLEFIGIHQDFIDFGLRKIWGPPPPHFGTILQKSPAFSGQRISKLLQWPVPPASDREMTMVILILLVQGFTMVTFFSQDTQVSRTVQHFLKTST